MGIFSRLTDIVNSNLNSILDTAEDPEKIIRMVIQEMEDTLVEVRTSAARAIADQKDVERKLRRLDDIQADWETKAELALSKGREDLAKGALVEKSKAAEMTAHLNEELDHLSDALGHHEEDVVKLEAKLREARAKKATIEARHTTATNNVRVRRNLYSNRIVEAFERFEKVEHRIDRLEGEAEAYELGHSQTLAEEIGELETEDAIQGELDALKSKLKRKTAASKAKAPAKK
jgi:phage shock protein A